MIKLFYLNVLFSILFSSLTTYAHCEWTPTLPKIPRTLNLGAKDGRIASLAKNDRILPTHEYLKYTQFYNLENKIKLRGLFFTHPQSQNLIIASFGFASSANSRASAQFVLDYVRLKKISAHVLVLDHVTSDDFFGHNGFLSPGGYDEAKMFIEVAKIIKTSGPKKIKNIYLLGVSMSGNAVIHALAEDARLGMNLFKGAISFSAVIDMSLVPYMHIASTYPEDNPFDWIDPKKIKFRTSLKKTSQITLSQLEKSINVWAKKMPYDLLVEWAGTASFPQFIFNSFSARVAQMDAQDFNPEILRSSLKDYLFSSKIENFIHRINQPLVLVYAQDDPALPYQSIDAFLSLSQKNSCIQVLKTKNGGHWGFGAAYGQTWLKNLIHQALNL